MAMIRDDELMGGRRQALLDRMGGTAQGVMAPGMFAGGSPTFDETGRSLGPQPNRDQVLQQMAPKDFSSKMHGYDPGKLNDPGHLSPKYQIGRVLRGFDPAAGITPDVLSALNALNIGTFSGSGDRLTLGGNIHPDYDGVGGTDDIITRFSGQGANPMWGAYTNEIGQAQQRAQQGMGGAPGPGMGAPGLGLGGLLSGDPSARIQQALSSFSQKSPNIEALLAQLAR